MDKRVYWIWLQNAFGPGSAKPKQIIDRMGDPAEFYRGGIGLWSSFRFISDKELSPSGKTDSIRQAPKKEGKRPIESFNMTTNRS